MIRELDELEDELQAALDAIAIAGADYDAPGATGLARLDRLVELKHLGVRVDFPSGENQDLYTDSSEAYLEEDVQVTLLYQLRTSGQMESRKRAHRLERLIRLAVTGWALLQANYPRFVRAEREHEGGWYRITQTFRLRRDAEVD